ncbi:MAG: transposase, partial [Anaerolinea sp.]|nr:transposase [Anaerolinea sp.]
MEREIAGVVKGDPEWHATARRITSIPGVGVTTAAWLIWLTQDFSTCRNAKELCAFVGV